jgi:hypothetical protein
MVEPTSLRKPDEGDLSDVPGVDVSLGFVLTEKTQMSMRTMFPQNTPAAEQERILARVISVAAITSLREKVIEFKKDRVIAEERLATLDDGTKQTSEIKAAIDALVSDAGELRRKGETAYRETGRGGEYKPVGNDKRMLDGIQRDIADKRQALVNLDADLTRQRDEITKAIKNWGVAIANAEREIAVRREAYEG